MEKIIKGSRVRVAYHQKQLAKLLPRAKDPEFLQMMWAVDALRAGRIEAAARSLSFPRDAADQSTGSRYSVHRWEIESLITQFLLTAKPETVAEGAAELDCGQFRSMADLVNRLRQLEDKESAVYLQDGEVDIFTEMHRIAQRQFHWQYGYFNLPQFYRYSFIYAQGECGAYFQDRYGLPITELSFVGLALYVQFMQAPRVRRSFVWAEAGLTKELVQRALPLLLTSMAGARERTAILVEQMNKSHGSSLPTAFLPSILRRFPLICLAEDAPDLVAPIADVLLLRVTSGLYYDLIEGGQPLLNEANERFEAYCAAIIDALMERFEVTRAYRYEPKKGASIDTPDILVRDADRVALIAECKATKLTYLAQFSEDPFESARTQYAQIANGVFQLWRFFSHIRQGIVKEPVDNDTAAVVLTLEAFGLMDQGLKGKIIEEAGLLADKEGNIVPEDRRHIVFCPINGLEPVLVRSSEDSFLNALRATREEKYIGWELVSVSKKEAEGKEKIDRKKFPFELHDLLPWWKRVDDLRKAQE